MTCDAIAQEIDGQHTKRPWEMNSNGIIKIDDDEQL